MLTSYEKALDKLRNTLASPFALFLLPLMIMAWRLLSPSEADPDLFARVAVGRLVQAHGAIPLIDPFAFTPTLPLWIDHEWLSGVVFWFVISHYGEVGLIALKLTLALWATIFVIRAARSYASSSATNPAGLSVWISLCMLHASFAWSSTLRCQGFTYLFLAFTYFALIQYQRLASIRYIVLLPILSIAWVNMHGGYALGMIVIWIFAIFAILARKQYKLITVIALLCSLAPFVTPYGFSTFISYLGSALLMERPSIEEWFPLFHDRSSFIASILLCLPIISGIALTRTARDRLAIAFIIFALYCGFRHIRLGAFMMITVAIFGAEYISVTINWLRGVLPTRAIRFERALALAVMGLAIFFLLDSFRLLTRPATFSINYSSYPVHAMQWLRINGASGKLLVDFNNGSFALWRLYPRFKISLDGRYEEVYPQQTVEQVSTAFRFSTAEGKAALKALDPSHILVSRALVSNQELQALTPEWRESYQDARFAIWQRKDPPITQDLPAPSKLDMWQPLF